MASYKKYAENLIGNWQTDQYEPQREVTQNIYQTNWNKLSNDFNTLKDKLARNFSNAQMEYSNILNDVQNQSFNRMRNADIDLATRGLSTSGVGNLIEQADTQQKGQDVDKALADLLNTNNASITGLTEGVMNLGQKQSDLAGNLAGDLAGITGQEAENAQQYVNLVAGLGNSAANRAASKRRSGGGSSSKASKEEKQIDEMYRTLGIINTLNDDSLSDREKNVILTNTYDVDRNTAVSAVNGYNNNKLLDVTLPKISKLEKNAENSKAYTNKLSGKEKTLTGLLGLSLPSLGLPLQGLYEGNKLYGNLAERRLNNLRNQVSGLDYADLDEILFGRR